MSRRARLIVRTSLIFYFAISSVALCYPAYFAIFVGDIFCGDKNFIFFQTQLLKIKRTILKNKNNNLRTRPWTKAAYHLPTYLPLTITRPTRPPDKETS